MARPEYPEYIECPYCYEEIELIDFAYPEPEPRPRRPGPVRLKRISTMIKYLLCLKAPYYVTAKQLHKWICVEFDVSPELARRIAGDLRRFRGNSVGYSEYWNGFNRIYWHTAKTQRVPSNIRKQR